MKKWFLLLLFVLPLVLWGISADARPGGGHTYSGGSSSYSGSSSSSYSGSSSSSDGGGEAIFFLIQLCFEAPAIGIPLLLCVIGFFVWTNMEKKKHIVNWSSMPTIPPPAPDLGGIRRLDPEFSSVLFEDFLYHLYSEANSARSNPEQMALLTPHISKEVQETLLGRTPEGVSVTRVVIGSMTVSHLTLPDRSTTDAGDPYYVKMSVRFEPNMTYVASGQPTKYYINETWSLARAANAKSETQEWMQARRCANCGAAFEDGAKRECDSCGAVFADARFGWLVTGVILNAQETRPASLTGYAPEVGTNDATRRHQRMQQELDALMADDPAFSPKAFQRRSRLIFSELYQAWNDDELARARPYISDSLFNYLRYWLDAYRHEGLANWVEDHEVTLTTIVKVVRDRHYDAITIRMWAKGKDYTVDKDERVVGGSKRNVRSFSEYWTLIRRANARGVASTEKQCPNCGAQQQISMAGNCEFCSAHITAGEFDWVLSKIEQDEAYRG